MIRSTAAFPPLPLHRHGPGRRTARLFGLLAAALLLVAAGCGGGGGGDSTPPPAPPSAPPAPPVVTIADTTVTATFATEAGYAYYVHWGQYGNSYGSYGPFDASPAQFTLGVSPSMYQFSLTRTRNGLESARTGTDEAPIISFPTVSLEEQRGSYNVLQTFIPNNATATSVYWSHSAFTSPEEGTWLGDVTDEFDNRLTHILTEFFESDLTPCTYHYLVQSRYEVGGVVKSVSRAEPGYTTSTPVLAYFRLHTAQSESHKLQSVAQADRLVQVAGGTAYWLCGGSLGEICHIALADAGLVSDPARYATSLASNSSTYRIKAFSVKDDGSAIYFIHDTDADHVASRYFTADGTEQVLFTHGAVGDWATSLQGLAQDASYLYLSTNTEILQVAKAAMAENATPVTTLVSGLAEPRLLTLAGGRLLYVDNAGLHYLTVPGGTVPVTVTADHTHITALAADGDQAYFIADSQSTLGVQALYTIDLGAPIPAVAARQEYLFGAHSLALTGGRVYWADNSKVYSVLAGGGDPLGHLTTTAHTVKAAGTGEIIVVGPTEPYLYKLPLAWQFPPPDVPAAPEPVAVTVRDSRLLVIWPAVANADGYSLYVNSVYQPTFYPAYEGYYANVFGLENGTSYPIEVRGANLRGSGTAAATVGTPRIAPPTLTLDPDDDRIVLKLSVPNVYDAQSQFIPRRVQFHLYRHTGSNVIGDGELIAEPYGETDAYGYIYLQVDDLGPANDGTYWFYNATVSDVALLDGEGVPTAVANPTTSEPAHVAGAEPYANAAPPLELVVGLPAAYDQQRKMLSWANGTLYWVSYDSYGSPQWQGFTYDGSTTRAPFPVLDTWDSLASDGTLLYAGRSGELAWIDPAAETPVATTLLTSEDHADFAGAITNLVYHHDGTDGWLIASVNQQAIIKVKTDGTGATTLYATGYTAPMGQLAVGDGWVYWSEQYRIKRIRLDGSGEPEAIYDPSGASGDVHDLAVSDTHLYWRAYGIHRLPLAGGDVEGLGGGWAVAVDPATGRAYWDYGDIFTLDGAGRRLTVATRPPTQADYQRLRILAGKVYSYSGNEIEAAPLLP